MSQIVVAVHLDVDPERLEEFLPIAVENARLSAQEAGCVTFELSQDAEVKHRFFFYEVYESAEAVQAHYDSAHFAIWKEKTSDGIITSKEKHKLVVL